MPVLLVSYYSGRIPHSTAGPVPVHCVLIVTASPVGAVRVRDFQLHVLDMRTRMPFRYGIASMTALPHLFVRLEVEVGGRAQVGLASEGLPPKWFTKDPT